MLAHHLDLLDGRARHDRVGHVVIVEMRENAFNMVDLEGATDALRLGTGTHHEVLDEKLAAAIEELCQRHLAVGCVENIGFLDLDPG